MFEDNLKERWELASDRIKEICGASDCLRGEPWSIYFRKTAGFINNMTELVRMVRDGVFNDWSCEELAEYNKSLYSDILEDNYDKSYANPEYAVKQFGEDYGRLLSFLYVELRGMIVYAYEQRLAEFTVLMELFIEVYCAFEAELPSANALRDIIYWYVSDYSDEFVEYRVREQIDTSLSFAVDIIMNEDLSDLRYLYKFGEYITENEIQPSRHLYRMSEQQIS